MITSLPAPTPVTIRPANVVNNLSTQVDTPSIEGYLYQLALLCLEVLRRPSLLPALIAILRLAPGTIETLRTERRRAA